jgi:hypothetical protein
MAKRKTAVDAGNFRRTWTFRILAVRVVLVG